MHSISEQVRQMHRIIRQIELVVSATRARVPAPLSADLDEILLLVHQFPPLCQGAEDSGRQPVRPDSAGIPGEAFADFFFKAAAPVTPGPDQPEKAPVAEAPETSWGSQMKTLRFSSTLLTGTMPDSHRLAVDSLLISIDRLIDLGAACDAGKGLQATSGRLLDVLGQLLANLTPKSTPATS